jgi:hypothetical protein
MNKSYLKRFEENLKIYNEEHKTNYTFEDVQEKFIDAGEVNKNKIKCMCDHDIKKNFEIKNEETGHTMIVGSICIKKYIPKAMSKCKECKLKFKFNGKKYCRICRRKISIKCNKCYKIYKIRRYKTKKNIKCKDCVEDEKNRCKRCNRMIDGNKYEYCYNCNITIKREKLKRRII